MFILKELALRRLTMNSNTYKKNKDTINKLINLVEQLSGIKRIPGDNAESYIIRVQSELLNILRAGRGDK